MTLKAVFWDMDGTLIDSEPYWHDAEISIAREHGGYWDEQLGWDHSGTPVVEIGKDMVKLGCRLDPETIGQMMIDYVAKAEEERMPWVKGVETVLVSLRDAGIPSVLVTTSPRHMAQNLIDQAPEGVFVGFVCGDDDVPKKPDPAPYLAAARLLGVDIADRDALAQCVAIEDSMTGLTAAGRSGMTVIAQTAFIRLDTSDGPQTMSLDGYDGVTVRTFEEAVSRRLKI